MRGRFCELGHAAAQRIFQKTFPPLHDLPAREGALLPREGRLMVTPGAQLLEEFERAVHIARKIRHGMAAAKSRSDRPFAGTHSFKEKTVARLNLQRTKIFPTQGEGYTFVEVAVLFGERNSAHAGILPRSRLREIGAEWRLGKTLKAGQFS
jgi:hypothetical protein